MKATLSSFKTLKLEFSGSWSRGVFFFLRNTPILHMDSVEMPLWLWFQIFPNISFYPPPPTQNQHSVLMVDFEGAG